jgi:hypothetical protein
MVSARAGWLFRAPGAVNGVGAVARRHSGAQTPLVSQVCNSSPNLSREIWTTLIQQFFSQDGLHDVIKVDQRPPPRRRVVLPWPFRARQHLATRAIARVHLPQSAHRDCRLVWTPLSLLELDGQSVLNPRVVECLKQHNSIPSITCGQESI